MGVDVAKAALAAGYKVFATGRNTEKITNVLGDDENLLVLKIDVTSLADTEAAVKAAGNV